MIPLNGIQPNPDNPRTIRDDKFERLIDSLLNFPKMMALRPIVVDGATALGGNMRTRALVAICEMPESELLDRLKGNKNLAKFWHPIRQSGQIPDEWVRQASELTEEEKRRFIITDNAGFGSWDWDALANGWDAAELSEWGLDVPEWAGLDPDKLAEGFALPDGDRAPFQQMTFTLADEQAEQVKQAMVEVRKTEEFKYCETFGNENGNGNALYLIIMQWAEQKILG